MKLESDERTVKITGKYKANEVEITISILQLAKVFQSDKKVLKETEKEGFGSTTLEDACEQTRELVKLFPKIKVKPNKVNCGKASVHETPRDRYASKERGNIIKMYGEDLFGWSNEGIIVKVPRELYERDLKERNFNFILKHNAIEFQKIK